MTVLELAASQIGTKENPRNSNNVKYNTWYYGREVYDGLWGTTFPWCMAFVQWCFKEVGTPLPYKTASCSALLNWYKAHAPERVVKTPVAGDIAIYNFGHTGIVESVKDEYVTCIEGNTSASNSSNGGEVMRATRKLNLVSGFIHPFEPAQNNVKGADDTVSISVPVVRYGSKGNAVRVLQAYLNAAGYNCGTADGDAGTKTITALKAYQKANDLDANGVAGKATWSKVLS